MGLLTLVLFVIAIVCFFVRLASYFKKSDVPNPFEFDEVKPTKPKVTDQKERDKIIKQSFKIEKVPERIDAIVIGSGIGGLSAAAILSKAGKKVLVLEQHDQAGGCCHTFIEKGYEFDVGIHYIGNMHFQSPTKTLLDQLSNGQITWEKMDDAFDQVVFKEAGRDAVEYPIYEGQERQKEALKKAFPGEEEGIDKFYDALKDVFVGFNSSMMVKFLPLWLVKLLAKTPLINKISRAFGWNKKTPRQVVEECTQNQYLRDVLCYCFLDYGTVPSQSGFYVHALLMNHFMKGAAYPIGGASEIAFHMIPVIERSGGRVLVNAKVVKVLVEGGRVRGVRAKHGTKESDLLAPIVVSDAGLYNTFGRMLPEDIVSKSRLRPLLKETKPGVGCISVFVGMNASKEELNIGEKRNYWIFTKKNIDKACVDYLALGQDEVEDHDIPLMFLSFPSTKDPTFEDRFPGKTTMAILCLSNHKWFQEWEQRPVMRRGDDYEGLKKSLGHKMIQHVVDLFPKIEKHIDYINIGTPLSNQYYLGSPYGEIYGLDHTQGRFDVINSANLRPATDVPGLYLTGQDVAACGMVGALYGGLFAAQQVLGRNVIEDWKALHKKITRERRKVE